MSNVSLSATRAPLALTPALVMLMATATGLAVAGNYYAQPLLPLIAAEMHVSVAAAGGIVTTAQLGYAAGLLLIVPLGDLLERRGLIVGMTLLTAVGLALTAQAASMFQIYLGTAIAGLCSVVAQVLLPLAASLAEPERRGRVVGTIMSGLLLGILLARTAAGALAATGQWRTVFVVGAAAMALMALVLAWRLPRVAAHSDLSYPRLLLSVLALFRAEPVLRTRAWLGAAVFAAFSMLWTSVAFLLAAPPFAWTPPVIGLLGLVGAAGALAAALAGRLSDGGRGRMAVALGLGMLCVSWAVLALAARGMVFVLAGVLLLDLAVQGVHVSNQGALYRIRPEARNRLTSAYMTSCFVGAALGSLLSSLAYATFGWIGVCVLGGVVSVAALAGCGALWRR